MKQRRWNPGGWWIMLTWGQAFSVGFHMGWGWLNMRLSGFEIMLGPLTISIIPPPPKWFVEAMADVGHEVKITREGPR